MSKIGIHSLLHLDTPIATKQKLFQLARNVGAAFIRLDVSLANVFPSPNVSDFSGVDQYSFLSVEYGVPMLVNLCFCPMWASRNADFRDPPNSPQQYSFWVANVVQHMNHSSGNAKQFELWNEPDGGWSFHGTPADYGAMLAQCYPAVHSAVGTRMLMGGLMVVSNTNWIDTAMAVPNARFDTTNIHVRTTIPNVAPTVQRFKQRFPGKPLWVTEMGYPADPAYQTYSNYKGGAQAQANYDRDATVAMWNNGADMVFATGRNEGTGVGASESIAGEPAQAMFTMIASGS